MTKVLVTRFSSLGDVAMLAVILPEITAQNPDFQLLVVSKIEFRQLFQGIENVSFIGVNLEDYKGIWGLRRLSQHLKSYQPDAYADCHNVLRTQILNRLLKIKKTAVIDKGRAEKNELTRKKNKKLRPIESMHERYADVFRSLGMRITLSHSLPKNESEKLGIGIAPFAFYNEKMLPLETSKELVNFLVSRGEEVMLFGGGELEEAILNDWSEEHPNITNLSGKFDLKEELSVIRNLKLMISMDSANMHLASLVGTRVISIWGATHPFVGFLGYGQSLEDCVQYDLSCRPCSVYGNKKCFRKDLPLECLKLIKSTDITEKINI